MNFSIGSSFTSLLHAMQNATAQREETHLDAHGLADAQKDLESQDRLGNFEIQDLMSTYNQAETLASSVMKKRDDTANDIIGKI